MADIVTGTVTGQLDVSQLLMGQSDIRREQETIGSDIRRDSASEAGGIVDAVKTSGWANSDRTGTEADRIVAQDTAYFIAGQSQNFSNATALAALKAGTDSNFNQTLAAIQLSGQRAEAASALEGAKNAAATALASANTQHFITSDGNATRALINTLKMDELNRMLVERNTEMVECRGDNRYWQQGVSNSQFAAVSSQLNAFQSQLQEARQSTVNFGSMSGNAGRNASTNNVA